MNHVDEYENVDRKASLWATVAIESQKQPRGFTLKELCNAVKWPYPLSKNDLEDLAFSVRRWNVRTNVDNEPTWRIALGSVGIGFDLDPMHAVQLAKEDKQDEKDDKDYYGE